MNSISSPVHQHMKHLRVAYLIPAFAFTACTTVAYEGASRPDSEIAIISSDRTLVSTIDGKSVPYSGANYAKFKVLPGPHTIGVTLNDTGYYPQIRVSKAPLEVRFNAVAGKTYVTRPIYTDKLWRPEIVEKP